MPIHPAIEANPKQLKRLAALLLALGDLADRAAGRAGALCWLVIWLLSPSEAVARAYVESLTPGAAWPPAPEPLRPRDGAAEALRLARSLRTFAAALAVLAALGQAARPTPPQTVPVRPPPRHSAPSRPPSPGSTVPESQSRFRRIDPRHGRPADPPGRDAPARAVSNRVPAPYMEKALSGTRDPPEEASPTLGVPHHIRRRGPHRA